GLFEVDEAAEIIRSTADPEANIIFGTVVDERMGDEISITVIATGFDASRKRDRADARTFTQAPAEAEVNVGAGLRVTREPIREIEQRDAVAVPVQSREGAAAYAASEPNGNGYNLPSSNPSIGGLPPAAAVQPRSYDRVEPKRGPQTEIEDLDIPAFLRRNR
ncbi:MAG TPA: hypothetical protein VMZ33_07110, partial [Candidatus Limnocylindrales bacterium]|nr:hypothetical protein [Candidatus Limnocylindrales bacterium]